MLLPLTILYVISSESQVPGRRFSSSNPNDKNTTVRWIKLCSEMAVHAHCWNVLSKGPICRVGSSVVYGIGRVTSDADLTEEDFLSNV